MRWSRCSQPIPRANVAVWFRPAAAFIRQQMMEALVGAQRGGKSNEQLLIALLGASDRSRGVSSFSFANLSNHAMATGPRLQNMPSLWLRLAGLALWRGADQPTMSLASSCRANTNYVWKYMPAQRQCRRRLGGLGRRGRRSSAAVFHHLLLSRAASLLPRWMSVQLVEEATSHHLRGGAGRPTSRQSVRDHSQEPVSWIIGPARLRPSPLHGLRCCTFEARHVCCLSTP